ncbi:MAG: CDP-alcohol phosphatidyltransferase family protein [Patescibacteria group bacterium]
MPWQGTTLKPRRLNWVARLRASTVQKLQLLPWPNINPTAVSALSVGAAIGFTLAYLGNSYVLATTFLVLNLLFDIIDGAIAEKYHRSSYRGWVIDTVSDRLSEGIILFPFMYPWYFFWAGNCGITVISHALKRSLVQPLRLFFLIYWIYRLAII